MPADHTFFTEITIEDLLKVVDDGYRDAIRDFWEDASVHYLVIYYDEDNPEDRELASVGPNLEFACLEEAQKAQVGGKPAQQFVSSKHMLEYKKKRGSTPSPFAKEERISPEQKAKLEVAIADQESRLRLLKQNEQEIMSRVQEMMVSEMKETRKKIERSKLEAWSKELEEKEKRLSAQEQSLMQFQQSTEEKAETQTQDVAVLQEKLRHQQEQLQRKQEEVEQKAAAMQAREEELLAREEYVSSSEETLIDKAQANFEQRIELEQMEEEIAKREAKLKALEEQARVSA